MATANRSKGCFFLVIIGIVCGAPLDEQRIYFPGENPSDQLESRSYGLQSNMQPQQEQPSYHSTGQDSSQLNPWSQGGIPQHTGSEGIHQFVPGYNEQLQSALQYQPLIWGSNPQNTSVERDNPAGPLSYSASASQHPLVSHSMMHPSSTGNGGLHGSQKHTWTSHYSTTGTGSRQPLEQQQVIQLHEPTQLQHSYSSSAQTHGAKDLSSIIDRPVYQSHDLHPNIKQALDNVIKDYGDSGGAASQPSHHTVHKISHIKKTSIHNIGKDPSHIHSTSSNDDISLSHLIEQLQMLEESPRHVNITWCEEKIKEFLRALRHKQASGVYINQQVQEQTLHQILTHEAVENSDSSNGVYEPPMTKVAVRPLGERQFSQSQSVSDSISHGQENHVKDMDMKHDGQSANHTQEESSYLQPEVLTIIPHPVPHLQPEIMSHQHESPKEAPPFTSDNSKDSEELELELPEYIPIEHTHSGDVDAFESNIQRETRPLPQAASGETSLIQSISTELQHKHEATSENNEEKTKSTEHEKEQRITQDSSSSGFDGYKSHHQELNTGNDPQSSNPASQISSEEKKEEEIKVVPSNHEESQKEVSYELNQSASENHYNVLGRPQAPEEENGSIVESSHEKNSVHAKHVGQSSNSQENSEKKVAKEHEPAMNGSPSEHYTHSEQSSTVNIQGLHKQQLDYDTLIEELIQLESIPGHQAIDKCEEKIQEFLEILKYQQEQGFGRNQQELESLHKTLIEQAQERSRQHANAEETTLSPTSFWRKVQKKIKTTYDSAKDKAKEVMGRI